MRKQLMDCVHSVKWFLHLHTTRSPLLGGFPADYPTHKPTVNLSIT